MSRNAIFILTALLCALGAISLSFGADILIGPEMEVQRKYAGQVLAQIDWELAQKRWELLIQILSPTYDDPAVDEIRHRLAPGPERWAEVRQEIIQKINQSLKSDAKAGIRASRFLETGDSTSMRLWLNQAMGSPDAAVALMSVYDKVFQRLRPPDGPGGLYELKEDPAHRFILTRDHDVFEIVSPPMQSRQERRMWVDQIHHRLDIPLSEPPALGMNPHFHLSRTFAKTVNDDLARNITADLRLLTALVTIEKSQANPNLKPPRPFYGGMNSVNPYEDTDAEHLLRGNVRYIAPQADRPTGFRFEIRSLGGMSWQDIDQYLTGIEGHLDEAQTPTDFQRAIEREIAERFASLDEVKLANAIARSAEKRYLISPEEFLRTLAQSKDLIHASLLDAYGSRKADQILAAKWGEVSRLIQSMQVVDCVKDWMRRRLGMSY